MLQTELVRALSYEDVEWFSFLTLGLDSVERAVVYEHELDWYDRWRAGELSLPAILTLIEKELTV